MNFFVCIGYVLALLSLEKTFAEADVTDASSSANFGETVTYRPYKGLLDDYLYYSGVRTPFDKSYGTLRNNVKGNDPDYGRNFIRDNDDYRRPGSFGNYLDRDNMDSRRDYYVYNRAPVDPILSSAFNRDSDYLRDPIYNTWNRRGPDFREEYPRYEYPRNYREREPYREDNENFFGRRDPYYRFESYDRSRPYYQYDPYDQVRPYDDYGPSDPYGSYGRYRPYERYGPLDRFNRPSEDARDENGIIGDPRITDNRTRESENNTSRGNSDSALDRENFSNPVNQRYPPYPPRDEYFRYPQRYNLDRDYGMREYENSRNPEIPPQTASEFVPNNEFRRSNAGFFDRLVSRDRLK